MLMRNLFLATAAVVTLTAGEGLAADLPRPVTKVPPAPLLTKSWSGCYVTGGGGYGFWNETTGFNGTPVGRHAAGGGWFGTVGGGCDLQVNGSWVIGVFGDYDFGGIRAMSSLMLPLLMI
jgi:outer membrane immunogenic protein